MACYHPLKGIQIPGETINHKPRYKIVPYEFETENFIEIPCGRCIGCRLAYSRMWADRCMAEATLHEHNYFITLTYDDDHLPYQIDYETGEILTKKWPTLKKRDVQLFMKRLRKGYKYENKIRFFLAGEYGTQSARPHYHAIMFGLRLDDLVLYKRTELGFNLYTSEFLSNTWGHGYVIIAECTWETCAYTARYILKKQNHGREEKVEIADKLRQKGKGEQIYEDLGIQKEFTLMSRKPGLARDYYEENKLDFLQYGEKSISTPKGGRKIKSVKYFNKLLEIEYPEEYNTNKEKIKEKMEVIKKLKLENTSQNYMDMLETEETIKKIRIAKLARKEI